MWTTCSSSYDGVLVGAEMGKVVTRVPPEPSGYLHIGHAKAAFLNYYFRQKFDGKFIVRFDDTNPAREKMEFEETIMEDLELLKVKADVVTHTSDYFEKLLGDCEAFIRAGNAYTDFTDVETMRKERGEGTESQCRSQSVEENLRLWEEMKKGSEEGLKCCVRAKIDMQAKNKCMRDPVMYRCVVDLPHHRTGTTYKVYPSYDFCCPVIDAHEGVTHCLRTNEYADRNEQYRWFLKTAGLRHVEIYDYSRMNFVNTVLSKRKLQWIVDQGVVDGWTDPRYPTVRGMIRRGLHVEALLNFILELGPSKTTNLMEWDKLWAKNKQYIDPIVPRYAAIGVTGKVVLKLSDGPKDLEVRERPLHPKNTDIGVAPMQLFHHVLIEGDDAALCETNEEITLMRWGNVVIDEIVKADEGGPITEIIAHLNLEGDVKKTKKKLHWLAYVPDQLPTVILREYEHLLLKAKPEEDDKIEDLLNPDSLHETEALADPLIKDLPFGTCLQFERRGYFRVDQPFSSGNGCIMIKIPDGKAKAVSSVASKVDPSKLAKGGEEGKKKKEKGEKKKKKNLQENGETPTESGGQSSNPPTPTPPAAADEST